MPKSKPASKDKFAYFRKNGYDTIWKVKRAPDGDGLHVGTAYYATGTTMDWRREHCPVDIESYVPVSESEVRGLEMKAVLEGAVYPVNKKFRPAPTPDDDEVPVVAVYVAPKKPKADPVGDPATEAFYRDRRAAALRCMRGEPNREDADHLRTMSRKIDVAISQETRARYMATVESEAGYSRFEEDEYKWLTGYTERKRK